MTAANIDHVGILVNDIHAGMAHFAALFGLSFNEPRTTLVELEELGQVVRRELTFSHSAGGPPFIELIQCNEDGLWGAQHGEGLHHVGSQFDGVVDKVAGLVADGHTVDARISFPGGDIAAVYMGTGHPHVHNTRLELMTPRRPDGGPA